MTGTVMSDEELLDLQRSLARRRRLIDAELAAVAAEIARRSSRELGYAGLAQRLGARTPERLVSAVTGVSLRDAGALVRVGGMTGHVADALVAGRIGVDAADAIRAIERPDLEQQLLTETLDLPPETVARRARELRDAVDTEVVLDRERQLRSQRYLRVVPQPDGMTRITGMLDPESAAVVVAAVDAATSPRRGGVRFVDPSTAPLVEDDRSVEQVAADAVVELIRIGCAAGATRVLGAQRPAVRVHVSDGAVRFEGQGAAASMRTAERYVCSVGAIPIVFAPDGQPLDVGRSQRLFTAKQRIALAARDRGCRFPGCDLPPSWCEAHHVSPWSRGGRTDIRDGVLLCRHHHLLVHDNHWTITRDGTGVDPATGCPRPQMLFMPPSDSESKDAVP
jgi:hypothetical protein